MRQNTDSSLALVATYLGGKLKETKANITVVIDGNVHKVPFGEPFIPASAGTHSVSVYWGAQPKRARPGIDVIVAEGRVAMMRWDGPRFIWQTGRLSVVA